MFPDSRFKPILAALLSLVLTQFSFPLAADTLDSEGFFVGYKSQDLEADAIEGHCTRPGNIANPDDPTNRTFIKCIDDGKDGWSGALWTCPDDTFFSEVFGNKCWWYCYEDEKAYCGGPDTFCDEDTYDCYGRRYQREDDCHNVEFCYTNAKSLSFQWFWCVKPCPTDEVSASIYCPRSCEGGKSTR